MADYRDVTDALDHLRARADGRDTPFTVLDAVRIDGELTRLRALAAHADPPKPDRWHVEDEARVPAWDLTIGNILEVVAWNDGVQLDDDFQDAGPHVDEIETYARKLLAAVAWHRRLAAAANRPDPVILASHAGHPLTGQIQAVLDEEGVDGLADAIRRVDRGEAP